MLAISVSRIPRAQLRPFRMQPSLLEACFVNWLLELIRLFEHKMLSFKSFAQGFNS